MEPTLREGESVLVFRPLKGKRGDLIVFKKNAKTMIKRIERIEGDKVYVKGDNWQESTDSQEFGALNRAQIEGKVIARIQ